MASSTAAPFDPMEPFARDDVLREVLDGLKTFDYKLYGPIPLRFHRGQPTKYEFDRNGIGPNGLPGGRSDDVPGRHVEPRAVPRALDDGALESALAQRPTQVGARVIETIHLPADLEQRIGPLVRGDALRAALRHLRLHAQGCAHGPSRGAER